MTRERSALGSAPRLARITSIVAAVLGLGHAAVSAYWASGGTALLDDRR